MKSINLNLLRIGLIASLVSFCQSVVYGQASLTYEYIKTYAPVAMYEMKANLVPASITLAQGILESSNGKSKLATDCNNHFGIKCKKNWTGTYCNADDDALNECFRGYTTAAQSYQDHSLFLKENPRYGSLFSLAVTDYIAWANGLKNAGYATNPAYPSLLIGLIERFNLGHFDTLVIMGQDFSVKPDATTTVQSNGSINGVVYTTAQPGDNPERIAKRNDMGTWQIYKYNDLKKGQTINPGEIVYLKPKRRKAEIAEHLYQDGENMRDISQKYGIKLKHVYKKNRIKPGFTPADGEVIYLQQKRKADNPITAASENKKVAQTNPIIPQQDAKTHRVQSGQTLYAIARAYGVTVSNLMLWNKLSSNELKEGMVLHIKAPPETTNTSMPVKTENTTKTFDTSIIVNQNTNQNSYPIHTVQSGETLYSIATKYGVSVEEIKNWNGMLNNSLQLGQSLLIKKGKETGSLKTEIAQYHTIQTGETLYSISRMYKLPVQELIDLNNLQSSTLAVGSKLRIK